MKWTDIKESKPEENQIVFAMVEGFLGPQLMEYAYISDNENSGWVWAKVYDSPEYLKDGWYAEGDWDDDYKVTHWMALPEPFKE